MRALLAWLALYHLTVGLISLVSPATALEVGARLYGISTAPSAAVLALMRPLGAYAVTIGFLAAAAYRDPARNLTAIDALTVLFALRLGHRLFASRALAEGLAVSQSQNLLNIGLLGIQLALLVLLRPSRPPS